MNRTYGYRTMQTLIVALALALATAGCAGGKGTKYEKGKQPQLGKAGRTGYFELRSGDGKQKSDALYKYYVERGQPLGFRRTTDRRLEAVAGSYAFTLRDANYTWVPAKGNE